MDVDNHKILVEFIQPWPKVGEAFLSLSGKLSGLNGKDDKIDAILYFSDNFSNIYKAWKDTEAGSALLPYEKCALSLVQIDLIEKFLSLLPESGTSLSFSDEFNSAVSELLTQLMHTGAVVGAKLPGQDYGFYSVEEFSNILVTSKKYNSLRLAHTMLDFINSEDRKEAALAMSKVYGWSDLLRRQELSWLEAFFVSLSLHLSWSAFNLNGDEFRLMLLEDGFYRALFVGAEVDKQIKDALYHTEDPLNYILLNKTFYDALSRNEELVKDKKLGEIFKEYLQYASDDWLNEEKQSSFVVKFLSGKNANKDHAVDILKTALMIFAHLKNADLIDHNVGGELTLADEYGNDLLLLLAWFGVGEAGLEPLQKYFAQDKPKVPLKAFVNRLREIADLSNDVTIDNLLVLTKLLRAKNILAPDEELVIFLEKEGRFVWPQ